MKDCSFYGFKSNTPTASQRVEPLVLQCDYSNKAIPQYFRVVLFTKFNFDQRQWTKTGNISSFGLSQSCAFTRSDQGPNCLSAQGS